MPSKNLHMSVSSVSSVVWPHGPQHTRLPCPSPTPRAHSNSSIESVMPSNHLILCHPFWSGLPSPPGNLTDPRTEHKSPAFPALQASSRDLLCFFWQIKKYASLNKIQSVTGTTLKTQNMLNKYLLKGWINEKIYANFKKKHNTYTLQRICFYLNLRGLMMNLQ